MVINIPDAAVPEITRRAEAAGFADVQQYVLTLLLPEHDQPWEPPPEGSGLEAAIEEGLASGLSATGVKEFTADLRARLQAKQGDLG